MIYLIQLFLKDVLCACTDLPPAAVQLNMEDALRYTSAPFASVLPQTMELRPLWQREQRVKEGGKVLNIRQKYKALLPMEFHLRAKNQGEAAGYLQAFLGGLPHDTVLDNTRIVFEPQAAEPSLGEGTLDLSSYRLIINCLYGIYECTEAPLIQSVDVEVKNLKK